MIHRKEAHQRKSKREDYQAKTGRDFLKARRSFHSRNGFFALLVPAAHWLIDRPLSCTNDFRNRGFRVCKNNRKFLQLPIEYDRPRRNAERRPVMRWKDEVQER